MASDMEIHHFSEQEAANSKREKAEQLQRKLDEDDFIWLMSDKRGRRVMWRQLLEPSGLFRNPFNTDSNVMSFGCGEQNQGHRLMAKLHRLCPDLYYSAMKENRNAK